MLVLWNELIMGSLSCGKDPKMCPYTNGWDLNPIQNVLWGHSLNIDLNCPPLQRTAATTLLHLYTRAKSGQFFNISLNPQYKSFELVSA